VGFQRATHQGRLPEIVRRRISKTLLFPSSSFFSLPLLLFQPFAAAGWRRTRRIRCRPYLKRCRRSVGQDHHSFVFFSPFFFFSFSSLHPVARLIAIAKELNFESFFGFSGRRRFASSLFLLLFFSLPFFFFLLLPRFCRYRRPPEDQRANVESPVSATSEPG